MKGKAKIFKRATAVFLSVAMFVLSFTQGIYFEQVNTAYAAGFDTSAPANIQDGTILQAFCWSFDTIRENMDEIAAAGYAAVQTSPIQACLDTQPGMKLVASDGRWYYHYQPTDFTIGNYQLGNEAQFEAMCDEADLYGIKIIVDVVPNHTATATAEVSENLLNAVGGMENLFHAETGLTNTQNYSDRLESTRYAVGNLPDIDTENEAYQDYFINFLNQCIAYGVDGFRYDSAKHIGLPGDPAPVGVTNNFWESVTTDITDAENIFNYGEVLQGSNDRIADYAAAIGGTTSSAYGASIRTALSQGNYMVSNISDYRAEDVDPNNLVTWVESHDNYYNDGTGSQIDNSQVILGWAIITARANGAPLFFSRPYGSSLSEPWGTNTIGIAGDDTYKDDQVVAVNKFRNAMVGEPENLTNPDGNAQVLMIERGIQGVVVVNGSSSSYALDTATNLEDGTYINQTDDNSVFTVINGEISGVLPARSVVVLYEEEVTNSTTVHFYNAENWDTVNAYVSGDEVLGPNPGALATNDGDGWWRVTVPADVTVGFMISFNDGGENQTGTLAVNDGTMLYYANDTAYASKAAAEAALSIVMTTVHFFNSSSWGDVKAFVYGPGNLLGGWPGTAARSNGDGWWSVDIPSTPVENLHIIFNNNNSANNLQSADFVINNATDIYVTNENANKYTSKLEALTAIDMVPGTTVAYFYNGFGWDTVNAYTWGSVNSGDWPGTAATDVGDGWWKIALPVDPSMDLNLIFNSGSGSQTANLRVSDITNRYFSSFNGNAYPSKAAVEALFASTETTTVYFYDSIGWDTVIAYLYGDSTAFGGWPGSAATAVGDDWWSIEIPVAPSANLHVIFNNGSGGGTNQSTDFVIDDATHIYLTGSSDTKYTSMEEVAAEKTLVSAVTPSAISVINGVAKTAAGLGLPSTVTLTTDNGNVNANVTWNVSECTYDPTNTAEQSFSVNGTIILPTGVINTNGVILETTISVTVLEEAFTTVYFFNNGNWGSVNTYVWGPGELLGGWPGTPATEEGGGWWKITIPCAPIANLNVIFNGGAAQTEFVINDATNVYVTGTVPTKFASKAAAEAAVEVAVNRTLVSAVTPSAITVVVNGTAKTAAALGLPATVTLTTDSGDVTANVSWNVDACNYNPSSAVEQTFTVNGTATLPSGVVNPNGVSLATTISVTVDAAIVIITDKTLVSVVAPTAIIKANGTAKTAAALGLPATVTLTTDSGNVTANVSWNVDTCNYNPSGTAVQTFTVNGTVTLPSGVGNPNSVSLEITISVTVNAATPIVNPPSNPVTPTPAPVNKVTEVTLGVDGAMQMDGILDLLNAPDSTELNLSVSLNDTASNTGVILSAEILAAVMEAGKSVSVTVKDEEGKELYTWSFDAAALRTSENDRTNVDLTIDVEAISEDETLGNTLGNTLDGTGLVMNFAYEGVLPAQASVRVYVGNIDGVTAGNKVYLYHYNHETGMLETLPYSSDYVVDADGYITVNILHCSDYVALTQEAPAKMVTSIRNQIKVTPIKQTLYVGTAQSFTNINIELPATLEQVNSLTDQTSQNAIGAVTVSYSTSNKKVAIVLANGKIRALGEGKAIITTTLTLYSGKVKTVKTSITVKKPSITFTSSSSSMTVGSVFTFSADAYGLNKADIVWTTSEKSIIVIDKKTGIATAKSKGTDYVIAKIGKTMVKIKVVVK